MQACRSKGAPICVGLDPVFEKLPRSLRGDRKTRGPQPLSAREQVKAIARFVTTVLEIVAPHVPCVKMQSACFERYLWPGVEAYHRLIQQAKAMGLIVIADAKRGDIGISADHYAAGNFSDTHFDDLGDLTGPDAITVSSYFGRDGLLPFIDLAQAQNKGVFALVRTSNPSSDALQNQTLTTQQTVAELVGQLVADLGRDRRYLGDTGLSLLGAVVGATKPADAARLRKLMPQQIFLVPGFGSQGGTADDVKACFLPQGEGAIITASRSLLYPFDPDASDTDWQQAIRQATLDMKQQIKSLLT